MRLYLCIELLFSKRLINWSDLLGQIAAKFSKSKWSDISNKLTQSYFVPFCLFWEGKRACKWEDPQQYSMPYQELHSNWLLEMDICRSELARRWYTEVPFSFAPYLAGNWCGSSCLYVGRNNSILWLDQNQITAGQALQTLTQSKIQITLRFGVLLRVEENHQALTVKGWKDISHVARSPIQAVAIAEPGIEPGSQQWEAHVLPLRHFDHWGFDLDC